jgi:hypothetical protein
MKIVDPSLGKSGHGIWVLYIMPLFFFALAGYALSMTSGATVDLTKYLVGLCTAAVLGLYAIYIVYCLYYAIRTVRILEYSQSKVRIRDFAGREFDFNREDFQSSATAEFNPFLKRFILYSQLGSEGCEPCRTLRFSGGIYFYSAPRLSGLDHVITLMSEPEDDNNGF